jgi:hypothetical protein
VDHHWTLQTQHQVSHLRKRSEIARQLHCHESISVGPVRDANELPKNCQAGGGMQRSTGSERTKVVASHPYSVRKSLSV